MSEAARELASIATYDEFEGKKQDWSSILQGELEKAQEIQQDAIGLKGRELEQAVVATFLHSQPVGQRALTRDLMVLMGASKPDRIELEKALRRWSELSWWLDESSIAEAGNGTAAKELPRSWRLGTKPNLKQMHSHALIGVEPDMVEMKLADAIQKEKRLVAGWSQAGARVHTLPRHTPDVDDDGDFHLVILGPTAASEPGKPSAETVRFIREKTSPDNPRTFQNAVLLVVPSRDGLGALKDRIQGYLAWEEVCNLPEAKSFDDMRKALLRGYMEAARGNIPDAVVQAYNIVVTVSAKGDIEAFRITTGGETLLETIKKDKRARIQESAISPDALLPGGPYDLWRSGETARRASDLVQSFAQFPHLPKMLRQKDILDTLALGCEQGHFVLRLARPYKSIRTIWRRRPTEMDLKERDLEVVLPEEAELAQIDSELLAPGAIPGLWPGADSVVSVAQILEFFDGKHVSKLQREGYEEALAIPRASKQVVEEAIREGVKAGVLWLIAGPASVLREEIPLGVMTEAATLNRPPAEIPATSILPQNLAGAWSQDVTSAAAISSALSVVSGKPLPWRIVAGAIDAAIRSRLLERTPDSTPWPCDWPGAAGVQLRVPKEAPPPILTPSPGRKFAEAALEPAELQDFADGLADVLKAGAGLSLRFVLRLELGDGGQPTPERMAKLNEALAKISDGLRFE